MTDEEFTELLRLSYEMEEKEFTELVKGKMEKLQKN